MNDNLKKKKLVFRNIIENINNNVQKNVDISIITYQNYIEFIEKNNIVLNKYYNIYNTNSKDKDKDKDKDIEKLQALNNYISELLRNYGTTNFSDILTICFDNDYINNNILNSEKFDLILKYCKPFNYTVLKWINYKNELSSENEIPKNKIMDDKTIIQDSNNLECFDLMRSHTNFNIRCCGIKTVLHDYKNDRTIVVNSIIDMNILKLIDNQYIVDRYTSIHNYYIENNKDNNNRYIWDNYVESLILKDILVYSDKELYIKFQGIIYNLSQYRNTSIPETIDNFNGSDLFTQRNMLINLLLDNRNINFKYLANAMYDLVLYDSNYKVLNSIPFNSKKHFKFAVDITKQSIERILNNNALPIEQQILLLNVNDNVKERAMQKLRELRSKSEDSGGKAKYYLDGLLKIPFGIFKQEEIFKKVNYIKENYYNLINIIDTLDISINKPVNTEYYNILNYLYDCSSNKLINNLLIKQLKNAILEYKRTQLINIIKYLYQHNDKTCLDYLNNKKDISKMSLIICRDTIINSIDLNSGNYIFLNNLITNNNLLKKNYNIINIACIERYINAIYTYNTEINNYLSDINNKLETSVYGHKRAKNYIERILASWITGTQTGICFGFEGPPGVGKTSLAKYGISKCLYDTSGETRPFNFIAIGGSNHGSIIDGHSYTYLGSTWGKIVDILMTSKCMNPIIFIDEIDKVSKTENGKEIISILTHLTDPTQNAHFQDKYFSNIDLDLSKAIFIFSYNDVETIDRILLDRIHRIKFDHLTLTEKTIISKQYIIPEICKNSGLTECINIEDEIIKFIINNYTNESGVRKLKEILYEIISHINLEIIKYNIYRESPIVLTIEKIKSILYDYSYIKHTKILETPKCGVINGMWANQLGNSGILFIETSFFATSTFLELKLTGMQGDVMRESMNVAKTLAWSLLDISCQQCIIKQFETNKMQGIHIHVPEGATPKDGPSAGMAITLAIYSLLSGKKICNTYAFTGEITLNGKVTEIGGLDLKIIGAIRAGVKNIVYPCDNNSDYKRFIMKYRDIVGDIDLINFIEINHINQVIKLLNY